VVKPFAHEELMARVRAVLRRRGAIPHVLEVEQLLVDDEHGFAEGWSRPVRDPSWNWADNPAG
jgi:DNA-binding response OmpR family regulator